MNPEEAKQLFDERLGRYQAAIAMEPLDRMAIACGSNYFAEVHSGNTHQTTLYDPEKWLAAEKIFVRDFPEIDVLRDNRMYGPFQDAVGCNNYRLPGRDLPPNTWFQFVERENMTPDEYGLLAEAPTKFMMERFLPRILSDLAEPGSMRSQVALLKAGMAFMQMAGVMRNRAVRLQEDCGMPQPMAGFFLAPFDVIADALRGLNGVVFDMFRRPDELRAACDALVDEMVNLALAMADPLKRWPIFVPTHKPMFLSPAQFDEFYWPSFKRVLTTLIDAGYKIRCYLEGDWGKHWHHMLELPKGSVLCDVDTQGDIFRALDELGHHHCVAGGVPESTLILGTPKETRAQVKRLCEAAGREKRLIVNSGCSIPHDTKAENYRAMIDAVVEFGAYDSSVKPAPKPPSSPPGRPAHLPPKMVTPWSVRLEEWGGVMGDEGLIQRPWEQLESMAYTWIWLWVL